MSTTGTTTGIPTGTPTGKAPVGRGRGDDAPLLSIRDLQVTFRRGKQRTRAVDKVSYDVRPGQVVGVVGESGSGKSVTALAVMGLLPRRGVEVSGGIVYGGRELLRAPESYRQKLRGNDIAMVFQDPMSSLNPVVTVGVQITEVLRTHRSVSRSVAREQAVDLLGRCGIPDPRRRFGEYPHQLSGGMRQRAMIAIALACDPKLIICDEPTTALDVTIQAQVLELLVELVRESDAAMIMITHDLGVVAGLCDHVNVMYAGRIVESASRRELFGRPRHRYTHGLLDSIPRLDQPRGEKLRPIPGTPRDVVGWDKACAFAPRCPYADDACVTGDLELIIEPSRIDTPMTGGGHHHRCVHPAGEPTDPVPTEHATDEHATDEGPTDEGPTDEGPTDEGPTDEGTLR